MANIAACLSTGKDDWETPDELFARYAAEYNFVLDAAANAVNHKCDLWFGPKGVAEDALTADWGMFLDHGDIWLNPPYSRGLQAAFVKKAAAEAIGRCAGAVVCLLPARTDTKLFHDYIYNKDGAELELLKGRIKFVNPDGPLLRGTKMNGSNNAAPFPSMIVVFS
jgi:site-specific DNA-methyltransferase (adenine-specific)